MKTVLQLMMGILIVFSMGCKQYDIITVPLPPTTKDVQVLEYNGPAEEKLDIVLVPCHFYGKQAESNPLWIQHADYCCHEILSHHFWKRFRKKLNIYRLDISTENDYMLVSEYCLYPDDEAIKAFAQKICTFLDYSQNDQVIFVTESTGYYADPHTPPNPFGQNSYDIEYGHDNIVSIKLPGSGGLIHELGHSFGSLGDEYMKIGSPDWKSTYLNIATAHKGDQCQDHWSDLMGIVIPAPGTIMEDESKRENRTVGCHFSVSPDASGIIFKPTKKTCIMETCDSEYPFCPICQRHLAKLLDIYSPPDVYPVVPGEYHDKEEFLQAAGVTTLINFDQAPNGSDIIAPAPGIFNPDIYAEARVYFTAGVIMADSSQPFNGTSPPNIISDSEINPSERALVTGYIQNRASALGITITKGVAELRIYDYEFNLISAVTSDNDQDTKDFIGLISAKPIYRFEITLMKGADFGADDLVFASPDFE